MNEQLSRHVEAKINEALLDTRVVVVNGARQAGKSTAVSAVTSARADVKEFRLDLPTDLAAARNDPEAFVDHDGLLVIDEIQRFPDLVLPIKARVDRSNRPGQFLLTGSARLLGLRTLPDALVGRSETIELWPFSQGEIDGFGDAFVDAACGDDSLATRLENVDVGATDRQSYFERAVRGGFPEAVARPIGRRTQWFTSYVDDLIDRDVTQLSEIQRKPDLVRLVRLLATRVASPLNIDSLAAALSVPRTSIDRYVALFEEVFLIKRISAWSSSETRRSVGQRKLIFVDSGIAAASAGITPGRVARDSQLVGPLLENFVLGELARQLTWSQAYARLYHYRDRDGREVDGVLELSDGRIVGVEVKASTTVNGADFRHLEFLRQKEGDQFHNGVVLYCGNRVVRFGDRMTAVPIDAVWRTPRPGSP